MKKTTSKKPTIKVAKESSQKKTQPSESVFAHVTQQEFLYGVIFFLSIICLSVALLMTVDAFSWFSSSSVCSVLQSDTSSGKPLFSCNDVKTSAFGSLFGIPLSVYGVFAFLSMILFSGMVLFKPKSPYFAICKKMMLLGSFCAGAFAVILLLIQAFILHQFCPLCLIVDVSSLIIAGFAYRVMKQK